MAQTTLADLIQHQEFLKYFNQKMLERSTLIKCGIATPDPIIANKVAAGSGFEGKTLDMPSLESLDNAGDSEVPVEATGATADKVNAIQDTAVVLFRRKKFAVTDVATIRSNTDQMAHIIDQMTPYWDKQHQKMLLSQLNGIFGANGRKARVAGAQESDAEGSTYGYKNGNDGDAILDITGEEGNAAVLDKNTSLLAAQLLGDHKADLTAVAMNSAVETFLAGIDTNAGLYRASEGPASLAKYNGRDIIVDDTMPYNPETKVATIYLFGKAAVAWNQLPTPHPFETDRDKDKAIDYIHSWVRQIIHVRGWKWNGTMAGLGPTDAELANAANWKRVYDKKRIPVVMLKCKIG